MRSVEYKNDKLVVKFQEYDKDVFFAIKDIVKSCDGSWFHMQSRLWTVNPTKQNMEKLLNCGFDISMDIKKKIDSDYKEIVKTPNKKLTKHQYKLLPEELRGYQIEGVEFLEAVNGCGIIGDSMGLGKTLQAISYLILHPELKPVLIVCPESLKINWMREIIKWTDYTEEDINIINGKTPYSIPLTCFYIINYDILAFSKKIKIVRNGKEMTKTVLDGGWYEYLVNELNIKCIIADEVQYINNDRAIRTMAILELCENTNKRILLSGTPIKNRPKEFFTALNIIDSNTFPNKWKYLNRYCDPKHNGYGWTFDGVSNLEELKMKIKKVMIRRSKEEVLSELPPKTKIIQSLGVNPIEYKNYYKATQTFKEWIKEYKGSKKLEAKEHMEHLKQLAYLCKRDSVLKWTEQFISTGDKLIVFGVHRKALDDLYERFKKEAVLLYGGMNQEQKQEAIDKFQNDENIKLFIGNIHAAGVGLNLTAASNVSFVEFWWNAADHEQAGDRCHRIGQKNAVNIYYLVAENTIEIEIVELIQEKSKILNQLLDGKNESYFEDSNILDELIKQYRP